ncbi:uncharacterized protein LOC129803561 isoform X4 [Phlebotomus papatasi]|uniref:uncharacterized protein LOC129803561 isoform X4 n=1 Tax=Phlebotomus papatasi TaxID=29031 RepID=UPI0024841A81|nr:uncharacterized protein LOC129803561 isoform X4 [Phlebotomus papatasi]
MKSELDFFLLHHRVFLVKNFYQCNGDYYGVKTKYEINYKDRNDSPKFSCDVLIEVVNLFEETGSVFKPPENTVQTACGQIEQVYIKTENPDEEYEDNPEVHCPVECVFDPPEIEDDNNVTHIRDVTQVQSNSSDSNTWSNNHEQFPLIQKFKTEIVDEEPEELPELYDSWDYTNDPNCKTTLNRNHTEHHDPGEEFSDGSLSKYEGPKQAKVSKKNTGKTEGKGKRYRIINEAVMQAALQEILQDKINLNSAATVFGIPKSTLFTRLKIVKKELSESQNVSLMMGLKNKEMVNKFASGQIFTMAQEDNLVARLLEVSKLNCGLTLHVTREVAYQYAISIGQTVPKSWEANKIAGRAWAKSFLKRHKEITTIRGSEAASLLSKTQL